MLRSHTRFANLRLRGDRNFTCRSTEAFLQILLAMASIAFCGTAISSITSAQTPSGLTPNPQAPTGQQPSLLHVWHEPPPPPSSESDWLPRPIQLSAGEVIEIDRELIRLENPRGGREPIVISQDRVVWLQPTLADPQAAEGMKLFSAGKYNESIPPLLAAIRSGPPVWQQQWLTAHLALAAYQAEKYPAALELVKQLQQSNPPPHLLALLPIQWHSRPSPPLAVTAAAAAVESESAATRLVAASWMLSSPTQRLLAERILDSLAANRADPWLARYAEVLRWRRTPVPRIADAQSNWDEQVKRFPVGLQGGPLLTMADRLAAAGERELAVEYYLSVALLYQRPKPLADAARTGLEELPPQ